jgi:hypothetical protein
VVFYFNWFLICSCPQSCILYYIRSPNCHDFAQTSVDEAQHAMLSQVRAIQHSGRKITESLGNVTVRGGKEGKSMEGQRCPAVCLSMYSITANIYYSQLSSVAILLQPEPVAHRIIQGKDCVISLSLLSSCGLPLPPTCLVIAVKEARSYFAFTIRLILHLN